MVENIIAARDCYSAQKAGGVKITLNTYIVIQRMRKIIMIWTFLDVVITYFICDFENDCVSTSLLIGGELETFKSAHLVEI